MFERSSRGFHHIIIGQTGMFFFELKKKLSRNIIEFCNANSTTANCTFKSHKVLLAVLDKLILRAQKFHKSTLVQCTCWPNYSRVCVFTKALVNVCWYGPQSWTQATLTDTHTFLLDKTVPDWPFAVQQIDIQIPELLHELILACTDCTWQPKTTPFDAIDEIRTTNPSCSRTRSSTKYSCLGDCCTKIAIQAKSLAQRFERLLSTEFGCNCIRVNLFGHLDRPGWCRMFPVFGLNALLNSASQVERGSVDVSDKWWNSVVWWNVLWRAHRRRELTVHVCLVMSIKQPLCVTALFKRRQTTIPLFQPEKKKP